MSDEAPTREPAPGETAPVEPPPPEELRPALARFERGDFRGASADVTALLAGSPTPEVAAAAHALRARMATDPWALRFGLLALTLLAIVTTIFMH